MHQFLSFFKGEPSYDRNGDPDQSSGTGSISNFLKADPLLHKVLQLSGDLVTVHNLSGGVVDCAVPENSFSKLNPTDLFGASFMERVHIADRPACLSTFSDVVHKNETRSVQIRLRCHTKGEGPDYYSWIEMNCQTTGDVKGETDEPHLVAISRDITPMKEREEKLTAQLQRAQEASDTKTRFLANMSHEMRTPLNTIIGFSDMMSSPGLCSEPGQQSVEYADIINKSGRHLLGVVDEVDSISQFETGKYKLDPEVFNIADLVTASLEIVQHEAEIKDVRLALEQEDRHLCMNADWRASKQALVNLLAGHVKAVSSGGRVRLGYKKCGDHIEFTTFDCQSSVGRDLVGMTETMLGRLAQLLKGQIKPTSSAKGETGIMLRLPGGFVENAQNRTVVELDSNGLREDWPMRKSA